MSAPRQPHERIIVALDLATPEEALAKVDVLRGAVGMFKVGSQLFTAAGPNFVHRLVAAGDKVFLDLKYHDIPNTVAGAVAEATRLGVSLVDVHALGGRAMLQAAVGALPALGSQLLAITILTSHDEASLKDIGLTDLTTCVKRLASLAKEAGADGVVCSPHEIELIRATCGPGFLVVTPGIRPAGSAAGDQARLATPGSAVAAGADYLVIGRPLLAAPDPLTGVRSDPSCGTLHI
jgi:orotidine-5'-phosphate decarboxylase